MKQKVSPLMIVVAVVVLAGVMFGMYKLAFAPQSPEPSAANAPAYAKQRDSAPGAPNYGVSYAQGGKYQNGPHPNGPGSSYGQPPR